MQIQTRIHLHTPTPEISIDVYDMTDITEYWIDAVGVRLAFDGLYDAVDAATECLRQELANFDAAVARAHKAAERALSKPTTAEIDDAIIPHYSTFIGA